MAGQAEGRAQAGDAGAEHQEVGADHEVASRLRVITIQSRGGSRVNPLGTGQETLGSEHAAMIAIG